MSQLRVDTNQVAIATHALATAKANITGARFHALAGLALDPSVLMRTNIRARIIDAAARLDRASSRIGRIEGFAYQACYAYDEVEARVTQQVRDPELRARATWSDIAHCLPWGSMPLLSFGVAAVGAVVASFLGQSAVTHLWQGLDLGDHLIGDGATLYDRALLRTAKAAGPEQAGLMALDEGSAASTASTASWLKWGGYGLQVVAAAWAGWEEFDGSRKSGDSVERSVSNGVVTGGVSLGASLATGAAIGTLIPVPIVGTLVGAVAGVAVGVGAQYVMNSPWIGGGRSIKDQLGDGVEEMTTGVSDLVNGNMGSAASHILDADRIFARNPLIAGVLPGIAAAAWL